MLLSGTELFSFPSLRMEMICSLNGMKRSLHQRHLNSVKHTLETSLPVTVRGNNCGSDQTKGPSDPLSPCNRQVHISSPSCRGRKYLEVESEGDGDVGLWKVKDFPVNWMLMWCWQPWAFSTPKHFAVCAGNTLHFPSDLAGEEGQCLQHSWWLIHMEVQGCYSCRWHIKHRPSPFLNLFRPKSTISDHPPPTHPTPPAALLSLPSPQSCPTPGALSPPSPCC